MKSKTKSVSVLIFVHSTCAALIFSFASNAQSASGSTVSASFIGNYFGGLPQNITGDTLVKQLVNTSKFPGITGTSETFGTDVPVNFSSTRFTQKFKLLVALDQDRSANFYIRPTGLGSTLPNIIGVNQPKGGNAFSGISARIDPVSGKMVVKLFGTADQSPVILDQQSTLGTYSFNSLGGPSGFWLRWTNTASYSLDADATAAMMTVYVIPSVTGPGGYIAANFNQATYDGSSASIVIGKQLNSSPFYFSVDDYSLNQWMQLPVIASSSKSAFDDDYLSMAGNIPAGTTPTDKYFGDNGSAVFLEHTVTKPSSRTARGISDDIIYCVSTLGAWCLERFFGAPTLPDSSTNPPALHPVIVTQPQPPSNIDSLRAYDVLEIGSPRRLALDDVDVALNMQACGQENPDDVTSPNACTSDDDIAMRAFTALSLNAAMAMRQALHDYADALQSGAASPPTINTNNPAVNIWAIRNPELAESLLDSTINVMRSSTAVDQPLIGGTVRNRGKKMIRASCVQSSATNEASGEEWECVKKARSKTSDAGNRTGVPPNLQRGGQYYMRDNASQSTNFQTLVREVTNRSQIPAGFSSTNFASSVRAIARDGASPGFNRGIVYIMDANYQQSSSNTGRRFGFGLAHILSPGPTPQQLASGIAQDASIGHREEWANLGVGNNVTGQNLLARIIMAALTSTNDARRQTQRGAINGGFSYTRDYDSIMISNGSTYDTYTNIRIVIGGNGNVITAFPLKGARHTSSKSDLK